MRVLLLLYLTVGLWVSRVNSSCEGIFSYGRDAYGRPTGVVRVAPPDSYRDGENFKFAIQLEVSDANSRGASLKLSLAEVNVASAVAKIKARQPITFLVTFQGQSLPKVISVAVSDHTVCKENRASSVGTVYFLSYTIKIGSNSNPGYFRARPSATRYRTPAPAAPANFERAGLMGRTYELPLSRNYYDNSAVDFSNSGSSCEGIYSEQLLGNEVIGLIRSPPPSGRYPADRVTTKVSFIVGTLLRGQNRSGQMRLDESLDVVAERLRATRSDPIRYIFHFPVQNPTPKIVSVEVNGREVCRANPNVRPPYSTFSQSHTVIPVAGDSGFYRPNPNIYRTIPQVITRPTTSAPSFGLPALPNANTCGTKESSNNLVRGGSEFPPGFWPWLGGIFFRSNEGPKFQCGGSLVTMRHVITAAHCMFLTEPSVRELRAQYLLVALGLHNIMNFEEDSQVQVMSVAEAIRHPRYNMATGREYDICVLVLHDRARYTPRVQPVCAWSSRDNTLLGKQGTVVGWGMSENTPTTDTPRSTIVPVVSREECRASHSLFATRVTENLFCAGNRNGKGPCNGDSGGGLYVHEVASDRSMRWVLRGIVSFSVSKEDKIECDLSHYVGYIDVNQFATWIEGIIY